MTNLLDQGFRATAYWGLRAETPSQCATRFRQLLAALSKIDPSFSDWSVVRDAEASELGDMDDFMEHMNALSEAELEDRIILLASMKSRDVIEWITEEVSQNDDGTPDPRYGYYFSASTGSKMETSPRDWSLSIHAGNAVSPNFNNTAKLESQPLCADNANLNTWEIFKPAMLALATSWDASWCGLCPAWSLPENGPRQPWFGFQWATYLGPALAKRVTPPQSALIERFANGGLLMVATKDRFDPSNLKHLTTAQEIAAALAPAEIVP